MLLPIQMNQSPSWAMTDFWLIQMYIDLSSNLCPSSPHYLVKQDSNLTIVSRNATDSCICKFTS